MHGSLSISVHIVLANVDCKQFIFRIICRVDFDEYNHLFVSISISIPSPSYRVYESTNISIRLKSGYINNWLHQQRETLLALTKSNGSGSIHNGLSKNSILQCRYFWSQTATIIIKSIDWSNHLFGNKSSILLNASQILLSTMFCGSLCFLCETM